MKQQYKQIFKSSSFNFLNFLKSSHKVVLFLFLILQTHGMEQTQNAPFGKRHAGKPWLEQPQQTGWGGRCGCWEEMQGVCMGREMKDRQWASVTLIKWVPQTTLKCRLESHITQSHEGAGYESPMVEMPKESSESCLVLNTCVSIHTEPQEVKVVRWETKEYFFFFSLDSWDKVSIKKL